MTSAVQILKDQPLPTWFGCGGKASRFARPASVEDLRACLTIDPNLRVLGDGANLLVADEGVSELVVSLAQGELAAWSVDAETGIVKAGAGANLPKLILECGRLGLGGLEGLGGIPASVGGAAVMNAGGNFGQTGDVVHMVHALDRAGKAVTLKRNKIEFTYRHARFGDHKPGTLILTHVEFKLKKADPDALRARLKEVMAYKKKTQPMADHSAGCFFKNPTLRQDLPGIAVAGSKISAGMLIDQAGCKGMRVGGAAVSEQHANFVTADTGCSAADILTLMRQVREKVKAKFGLVLENEVVVWGATL